ncbi:hypothetical protein M758_3G256700 [Ceratodon purpureus]|nr:hypothetical protein M758_3G256700 [Ceratodon purpureus]
MQTPRSAAAMAPHFKHATGSRAKVNLEVGGSSTQTALHPDDVDAVNWDLELTKIFPSLRALRGGIMSLVEAEQRKSGERRHLAYAAVSKGKARHRQEKERAITFGRKIAESRIAYDGAVQEYERSRGVLAASMYGGNDNTASQDKRTVTAVTQNCEALVNSCYARVQVARNRLGEWEFKSERHTAMMERLLALLKDAEDEYRQICKALDEDLADLSALTDFLGKMDT